MFPSDALNKKQLQNWMEQGSRHNAKSLLVLL
jgi:hypothetical protein